MNRCCRNGFLRPQMEARSRAYTPAVMTTICSRLFSTTRIIQSTLSKSPGGKKKGSAPGNTSKVDIVNEQLCSLLKDDIVQQLSNVLAVNKPSVILDLYPGRPVLSSKVHDLVQPFRHVLVEPRTSRVYHKYLQEFSEKKDGIQIHKEKVHYGSFHGIGWMELLDTYVPAEVPPGVQKDLLVIANLTDRAFKNASRIWAALVGHTLLNRGRFSDWTVRTLMILPPEEADMILPRSVRNRRKVAILNEAYSRQSFVVAETDNTEHIIPRGYELVGKSADLVAQRMAESQIVIPKTRRRHPSRSYTEIPAGPRAEPYTAKYPLFVGEPFKEFLEKKKLYEDIIQKYYQEHGGAIEGELERARARARVVHLAKELAKRKLEIALISTLIQAKLNAAEPEEAKRFKDVVKRNPKKHKSLNSARQYFRVRAQIMHLAGDLAKLELQIRSCEETFVTSKARSLELGEARLYQEAIKKYPKDKQASKIKSDYTRARASVVHLAKAADAAVDLAKQQIEIASLEERLAKAKLDPTTGSVELERQNSHLVSLRKQFTETSSEALFHVSRKLPNLINDYRIALGASGDIKNSRLLWDHRPYEPLYIHPKEVTPKGSGCSIIYIEPESKEELFERFAINSAHDRHDEAVEMALSVVGTFGIRARETVADMLEKLFPGQPPAEVIKIVPELFDCIPKQLRATSINKDVTATSEKDLTPTTSTTSIPASFYDEFKYMPDQITLQCLPLSAILGLLRAYFNTPNARSFLQVNRSLGGSATLFALRSWVSDDK
ncbi:conserved hypothetical protein [Talaromyces stipitatus ATCC 10500]|uniref:Mitochondrial transcription factor 1 n=1 Tax=Talaromyces stipitatus (strain ATCC 10500 / CBS 375.48 / QM 6759 / NRRL 1006) TaxID=441959 RepID=B8MTD2_TALSN|nr:uncharacterized protein TSTA_004300 [Talaromyces stipitatus ATCC 10500]EED12381.1 conserved hypothetical protein [Talaromyces stipitatus ATCC 10500]